MAPLQYDDIEDLRYNPFTNIFTPNTIGTGGVPAEVRTIPNSSPYIIKLYEAPQQNAPSTTVAIIGGTTLTEVSSSVVPAANQYRVIYYDELGMGQVEFHSSRAGQEVTFRYYGLGHLIQKISLDTRVPSTGDTIIAGNKTFPDTVVVDGGTRRGEAGTILKEKIIEIGDWNMQANDTPAVNPPHGLGNPGYKKIRSVMVIIRADDNTIYNKLERYNTTDDLIDGGVTTIGTTAFLLNRRPGGFFATASYNSTTYNRGWIFITYED